MSADDAESTKAVGRSWLRVPQSGAADTLVPLAENTPRLTIGRDSTADIPLSGHPEVSRLHAVLELIADEWTIADHGVSTNGTFVNGERVFGRRRLCAGDTVGVGDAQLVFEGPVEGVRTAAGSGEPMVLTKAQTAVLRALCRPFLDNRKFANPATNQDIAAELGVTVETVARHLQALYERFDISELPQNRKRSALVNRAMTTEVADLLGS
ncbi:FHA domain-containing protein [Antrihabitans sp. YC2-6]|uniref:FHA domain-containing protein n=1 Tax=Antrihabitans sp. YC2-6 TaxID=2799498 RepID=UPI0018F27B9A|nr:FHA domain-containing protein [Antrihabitans sp. YC2-6]MBJ8345686.1 FHA domain-containing protein [Antrihabitans sp. YC2-6]